MGAAIQTAPVFVWPRPVDRWVSAMFRQSGSGLAIRNDRTIMRCQRAIFCEKDSREQASS
jgi:hypothetical protein